MVGNNLFPMPHLGQIETFYHEHAREGGHSNNPRLPLLHIRNALAKNLAVAIAEKLCVFGPHRMFNSLMVNLRADGLSRITV